MKFRKTLPFVLAVISMLSVTTQADSVIYKFVHSNRNRWWRPGLQSIPMFELGSSVDIVHTDEGDYDPPISTYIQRWTEPVGVLSGNEGLLLEFGRMDVLPGRATDDFFTQFRIIYGSYYDYETQVAFLYTEPLVFRVQSDGKTATLSGHMELIYPGPVLMSGSHPGTQQPVPVDLPNGSLVPFELSIINTSGQWSEDSFDGDFDYDIEGYYDFSNAIVVPEPSVLCGALMGLVPLLLRRRKIPRNGRAQ